MIVVDRWQIPQTPDFYCVCVVNSRELFERKSDKDLQYLSWKVVIVSKRLVIAFIISGRGKEYTKIEGERNERERREKNRMIVCNNT